MLSGMAPAAAGGAGWQGGGGGGARRRQWRAAAQGSWLLAACQQALTSLGWLRGGRVGRS